MIGARVPAFWDINGPNTEPPMRFLTRLLCVGLFCAIVAAGCTKPTERSGSPNPSPAGATGDGGEPKKSKPKVEPPPPPPPPPP